MSEKEEQEVECTREQQELTKVMDEFAATVCAEATRCRTTFDQEMRTTNPGDAMMKMWTLYEQGVVEVSPSEAGLF